MKNLQLKALIKSRLAEMNFSEDDLTILNNEELSQLGGGNPGSCGLNSCGTFTNPNNCQSNSCGTY